MNRPRPALAALALLLTTVVACSSQNPTLDPSDPGPTVTLPAPGAAGGPKVRGAVSIYVAPELAVVGKALTDAFAKANPRAEVSIEAEPSKESILRFVAGNEADVMVAESKNIRLLDAYVRGLPQPGRFGIDPLVLAVPRGNPAGIRRLEDAGQLPPEAVCTPPYLLEARSEDLDDLQVPVNEDSAPDCGTTTVDAVATGDLAAAAVPGSAVNFVRLLEVSRVRLSLTGGLYAAYEMALANNDNDAAIGFRNFVASRAGRNIITGQGYTP